MSLFDVAAKVITTYRANVDEHVRALEKLAAAGDSRAKSEIDNNKRVNTSITDVKSAYESVTGTISAMWGAANDALNAYAQHQRMVAAAGESDLGRLSRAANGLKTETELLTDAARLQHGQFRLTADQMDIAERAMLGLTRQGYDAAKSSEAVLHAVTALKIDGLEDLGVHIDKTGLSMDKASDRAEILKRTFEALAVASRTAADGALKDAEKYQQTAVKMDDAGSRLKQSMGWLLNRGGDVSGAQSALLYRIFTGDLKGAGDVLADESGRPNSPQFYKGITTDADAARTKAIEDAASAYNRNLAHPSGIWGAAYDANAAANFDKGTPEQALMKLDAILAPYSGSNLSTGAPTDDQLEAMAQMKARAILAGAIKSVAGGGDRLSSLSAIDADNRIFRLGGGELGTAANNNLGILDGSATNYATNQVLADEPSRRLTERWKAQIANLDNQGDTRSAKSRLESIFGPIDQFNAYKAAFDVLGGAVKGAMSAWIDGSMSAGAAIKKALAEGLKAEAVNAAFQAIKMTAMGIGFSFMDPPKAAAAFASAAEWGAAAVAATAGAKLLGGSGGGASASGGGGRGGAGATAPVGGAGGYDPGSTVVYVVGDPYGDQTSRQRANNFKKQARAAGVGDASGRAA